MPDAAKPVHPRKIEIAHAAIHCFLEQGYHQTGVRDIARRAGVSLGNLYNHFAGKEAVLAFIAELESNELSEFIALLSEPIDPLARLEQFIEDYAVYVARPENALLGIEILVEALRNPAIADVFDKNRNLLVEALATCIGACVRAGSSASTEGDQIIAGMILDALEGNGLRYLSTQESLMKATQTLKTFLINGLRS